MSIRNIKRKRIDNGLTVEENMKNYYKMKRDEYKRAYQAALEMDDIPEAERLFKEFENYDKMLKSTTNA